MRRCRAEHFTGATRMTEVQEPTRADFPHFTGIPTRWQDCDVYGHVNNVVYYAYFDTAVTGHLVWAHPAPPMQSACFDRVRKNRRRSDILSMSISTGRAGGPYPFRSRFGRHCLSWQYNATVAGNAQQKKARRQSCRRAPILIYREIVRRPRSGFPGSFCFQ